MTPSRIKIISILVLIGAYPLSGGQIFNVSWLSWTGVAIVGFACSWFVLDFLRELWRWIRSPKCRVVRTESKATADEYLRLGWTLKHEFDDSDHDESSVYLLEWLGAGDPVHIVGRPSPKHICPDKA